MAVSCVDPETCSGVLRVCICFRAEAMAEFGQRAELSNEARGEHLEETTHHHNPSLPEADRVVKS